jgi:hypothetical protein
MLEVAKFSSKAFGFTSRQAIAYILPHRDKEQAQVVVKMNN